MYKFFIKLKKTRSKLVNIFSLKEDGDLTSYGHSNASIFYKQKTLLRLDCPQKVRHYLGVFLWKEKSSLIMRLSLNA